LDVAQLIKHALGLANCFKGRATKLLYLFWEPVDWQQFSEFTLHRLEAQRFADAVKGAEIEFAFASYSDLWAQWSKSSTSDLQRQADALIERYVVVANA
jgi:hypothetical protein